MEHTRRTVLLLSGGIDSALCGRMLAGRRIETTCLFVDYGQAPAAAELAAARKVAASLGFPLEVRAIEGAPPRASGEHPGRNALLVAAAAFEAGRGPADVVIGIHAGSGYFDCSPRFLSLMDMLLQEQTDGRVSLMAPLLEWSKQDVLDAFAGSGLRLEDTHSCESSDLPCGSCRSCLDRKAA